MEQTVQHIEELETMAVIHHINFDYVLDESNYHTEGVTKGISIRVHYRIANSPRGATQIVQGEDIPKFLKSAELDYGQGNVGQDSLNKLKNRLVILKEVFTDRVEKQAKGQFVHATKTSFDRFYNVVIDKTGRDSGGMSGDSE